MRLGMSARPPISMAWIAGACTSSRPSNPLLPRLDMHDAQRAHNLQSAKRAPHVWALACMQGHPSLDGVDRRCVHIQQTVQRIRANIVPCGSTCMHPAGRGTIGPCADTCAMFIHQMRWTPWPTSPSEKEAPHASRGRQAQAPPSIFANPLLCKRSLRAGEARGRCRQPLRDTSCGRLAGGREAGGELGEDANGELSIRGHGGG